MAGHEKLKDLYRKACLGDTASITQTLREMEGLLQVIARKYYSPGMTHDDISQLLRVGAWKGIVNFDIKRLSANVNVNKVFISWVARIAEQYLWRDFQLRNPERRGRRRTVDVYESTSLDSRVSDGDTGWTRHEVIADNGETNPHDIVERKDARMRLDALLSKLSQDERTVIQKHYAEGESFAEIGRGMKKSREWISKLHKKAIIGLRDWWSYEKKYGLRLTNLEELFEGKFKNNHEDKTRKKR